MHKWKPSSITKKLTRSFLSSTFIPFLCIITLSVCITNQSYHHDILRLTEGYLQSLSVAISQYLKDIEQVALLPYFNDPIFADLEQYSRKKSVSYIDREDLSDRLNQLLSSVRYTRGDFYAGLIVSGDKVLYASSNYTYDTPKKPFDWSQEQWYRDAMQEPNKFRFLPLHKPDYYEGGAAKEVISIVGTIRKLNENKPFAVIKLDLLPSYFDYYLAGVNFHVPSVIAITDRNGHEIYRKNQKVEGTPSLEDVHYLHVESPIPDSEYQLHVLLDRRAIAWKSQRIYLIGILFYLVALAISTLLNLRFSRGISASIEEIKRVLEATGKGDFSARFHPKRWWELQDLGEAINDILTQLESNIQHTYVAELKRGEAERRALQSQIQPHFLFNTLDSMLALLYEGKYELLEESLYSLSSMLRYVLAKDSFVTLREEADFLSDYLLLLHNRFSDRLEYQVSVSPEAAGLSIPRLLLQPFVENSVIHGMEPLLRKTHIWLKAYKEAGNVVITIEDDGAGFDQESIDLSKRVGISNCISRIKLLSEQAVITITSEPGSGCQVHIVVPLEAVDENSHSR